MDSNKPTIVIVGSGFCGTLVAVHLLKRSESPLRVILLDKRQAFGLGAAYSTTDCAHLLNVPTSRMSAFPSEPSHFLDWLMQKPNVPCQFVPNSYTFAPRLVFGMYVQELLAQACQTANQKGVVEFEQIHQEVLSLERTLDDGSERLRVSVADGPLISADAVVLALGNLPPRDLSIIPQAILSNRNYVSNPWSWQATDELDPEAHVVLLGSGLTAVDMELALRARGHTGKVTMISRHGLLPMPHKATPTTPPKIDNEWPKPESVQPLMRWLRERVLAAEASGLVWQDVVDALRPHLQTLWRSFSARSRTQFLRHLRVYWDVHRHRMAPSVAQGIAERQQHGQLCVLKGRVLAVDTESTENNQASMMVSYRPRHKSNTERIVATRVINCIGPEANYEKADDSLLQSIFQQGIGRADPLKMGFDINDDFALLDRNGEPSSQVFTLGPPCKGYLWESVAVPELRGQAEKVADLLLAKYS